MRRLIAVRARTMPQFASPGMHIERLIHEADRSVPGPLGVGPEAAAIGRFHNVLHEEAVLRSATVSAAIQISRALPPPVVGIAPSPRQDFLAALFDGTKGHVRV